MKTVTTKTPLALRFFPFAKRGMRFHASVIIAAITLAAAGPAGAFPTCIEEVNNPQLNPPYPMDPAVPYTGTHTHWSTDGVVIKLKIGDRGVPSQFYIRGINYEPTQIGGSADFPPFNDFFYTNSVETWDPLWSDTDRGRDDIELMRAMGVNSIRTYGVWKWEVTFANGGPPPHNGRPVEDGLADFWQLLNFTVDDEEDNQFCDPDRRSLYALKHPTHKPFLDKLWNNGRNPIYIWIGLSVPLDLVDPNVSQERKHNLRQFYRYTAKWLAKKYGNHPAVMGFVVGNEIDTAATTPTSNFWETLNDLNAVIKASAPDKLTVSTFHDTNDYNRQIVGGRFNGQRGPQVYEPDVWGFNPYTNPIPPGNLFHRFKDNIVAVHPKPMLFGEFGVPADTHQQSQVPRKAYPVHWSGVNFIWQDSPPPAMCLPPGAPPPPGAGGDGPNAEFRRRETIARELPARAGDYKLPRALVSYFMGSGIGEGDSLKAADQADWIADFWRKTLEHTASNGPNRDSDLLYSSGGYVFEWRDEWWKANPHPCFHSITGNQDCGDPMWHCPERCDNTGAANPVFPGGWGDEQWFGVTGARVRGRMDCAPVINSNTGQLNGGPDILIPRAAVRALYDLFHNSP